MKYAGVRAIRAGQPEAVAAVRMSGSEVVFAFAVEHAEGPVLTVREALDAERRPITGITVEGSTLTVHVPDLANLYMGDHVSIDGVSNENSRDWSPGPCRSRRGREDHAPLAVHDLRRA